MIGYKNALVRLIVLTIFFLKRQNRKLVNESEGSIIGA